MPSGSFNATSAKNYFNGMEMEENYMRQLLNSSLEDKLDYHHYACSSCAKGCESCVDETTCMAEYNTLLRLIPVGVESLCITVIIVLIGVAIRLRNMKVS